MKGESGFAVKYLFFLPLLWMACSYRVLPSAEVNLISDGDGTVTVRSVGIALNQADAIEDAELRAVNVLLFRGLPHSIQRFPMIGSDESGEISKHKLYFDQFYGMKRYKTFLMSSVPATVLMKHRGGRKSIYVDVKLTCLHCEGTWNNLM